MGNGDFMVRHGMRRSKIYAVWENMMTRCYNQNFKFYKNYGGRGIKVCDKWHIFSGFYEDMRDGYREELTLDRENNDGDYYKENCRWVTNDIQQKNKRNNKYVKYNDESKTISEWSRQLGINVQTLSRRLQKGINPPRLFQKVKKGGRIA